MIISPFKNEDLRRKLKKIRVLIRVMRIKPRHIIIPVALSFIAAIFTGGAIGLFVPIAKGVSNNDFSFIADIPVLGSLMELILGETQIPQSSNVVFLFIIGLILIMQFFRIIISYLGNIYTAYWHGIFKQRISIEMFNRYLSFGKLFYDRASQGKLQTTLSYPDAVLGALLMVQQISVALFEMAARLVIMIIISWKLTLLAASILPVLYIFIKIKARAVKRISIERRNVHLEVGRETFNTLSGIAMVKSYAREEAMSERFGKLHEKFRKLDFRAKVIMRLAQPAQELIIIFAFAIIILTGNFVFTGFSLESTSVMIVFLYAAKGIMPHFAEVGKSGMAIADVAGPLAEVVRVFDDNGKFAIPEGDKQFKGLEKNIQYKNVNFSYNEEKQVLHELTFTIEKNAIVALVGPSGAGKTTIASLLLRLYDCDPGSIYIDGTDIRNYKLSSLQEKMSYVSQESILFNDTLRMNLTFGLDEDSVSEDEIQEAIKKARLHDFVKRLPKGLNTEIGDRGVQLSGGEKQRLSIARALLRKAEILILDEATSSLDSQTEKLIQEAIDEAVVDRTAIVIAHRLSTIKNADKIVVIRDGHTAEEGTLDELVEQEGIFYKLWQAQQFY